MVIMTQAKNRLTEIIVLTILYVILLIAHYTNNFGWCINFIDTDDHMQVIRIKEFFEHLDWHNSIIARGNYPYGCDLHWTRLYDFFIIILSLIFRIFTSSIDNAIEYACFCISPLIGVVCLRLIFEIFSKFMKKDTVFIASAVFCASPFLLTFFTFGRPDHHAFIVLCLLAYVYDFVKTVSQKTDVNAIHAALLATACIWTSPETLIVISLSDFILFISAFERPTLFRYLFFKNLMTTCFVGIVALIPSSPIASVMLAIAAILICTCKNIREKLISIFLQASPALLYCTAYSIFIGACKIAPVEYDKISAVHISLFWAAAIFFAVNSRIFDKKHWLLYTLASAFFIGIMYLITYPLFFFGMSGQIPDYVKEIWLSKISEMQSPFASTEHGSVFFVYSLISVTAIIVKAQELIKNRINYNEKIIWCEFLTLGGTYLILTGFANRMNPYAELFMLPMIVSLGMSSKFVKNMNRIRKILLTMFLAILYMYAVVAVLCLFDQDTENKTENNIPQTKEEKFETEMDLLKFLDDLSPTPAVIMADSNDGPKILHYTKHRILGANYHRQIQGIISSYNVMRREYDEKVVMDTIRETKTKFIFVRNDDQVKKAGSFASRILEGKYPTWIRIVELPKKFSGAVIAEVAWRNSNNK